MDWRPLPENSDSGVTISKAVFLFTLLLLGQVVRAATPTSPILIDKEAATALAIPLLDYEQNLNVGLAHVDSQMEEKLQHWAHENGRCGGYESLDSLSPALLPNLLQKMQAQELFNIQYQLLRPAIEVVANPQVTKAVAQVSPDNLREWVTWLTAFPTRNSRGQNPNAHVDALFERLQGLLQGNQILASVSLISHRNTPQKTIHVRIPGSLRPNEIVVLGAHLDSVNLSGGAAPGADDNASGSSNLLEALRILLLSSRPERTIDIFWYAGEESGLRGSSEIAAQYQSNRADVIAVLQLDMTLFPGDGELNLSTVTDFTSAWLRDYLAQAAREYLNIRFNDTRCGYGCSDHASWYRQGFSTVFPLESQFATHNRRIHSSRDQINETSSFVHSAQFSKLALIFALDLGNRQLRNASQLY